ncbi:MAG: hypothetical protein JSU01_04365 [Bacteroidetes bacterium]|nr:hypothetical protein [Bacteroidota bacterium]
MKIILETILAEKLRSYIVANNPDLMLSLQQQTRFSRYVEDKVYAIDSLIDQLVAEGKPQYVIEELCLNAMTEDLRPSRFNYLKALFEEEFSERFERYRELGVLTYELTNMVEHCQGLFEHFGFSEDNEDDRLLRYAVIGAVDEYLNSTRD